MANMLSPEMFKKRAEEAKKNLRSQGLPIGEYYCLLKDTWHGVTKKGEGVEAVSFTYQVLIGDHAGQEQMCFYMIGHESSTVPLNMFFNDIEKLGHDSSAIKTQSDIDVYLAQIKKDEIKVLLEIAENVKNPSFPKIIIKGLIAEKEDEKPVTENIDEDRDLIVNKEPPSNLGVNEGPETIEDTEENKEAVNEDNDEDEGLDIELGDVIIFEDPNTKTERNGVLVSVNEDKGQATFEVKTIKGTKKITAPITSIKGKV